jgi:hypothetical protein
MVLLNQQFFISSLMYLKVMRNGSSNTKAVMLTFFQRFASQIIAARLMLSEKCG